MSTSTKKTTSKTQKKYFKLQNFHHLLRIWTAL